jgi:electron transport complex protein RnfE
MSNPSGEDQSTPLLQQESAAGNFWKELFKGLVIANPLFVIVLGLCPALAVSVSLDNAIGMSAGVFFVLLCSNAVISAMRKVTPDAVRFPVLIVVISTFATIMNLAFHAYAPAVYTALGIYLPLVAVNCIILGRAESFARKNSVLASIADAVGMSLGFFLAIALISFIRQSLGTGSISVFSMNLGKLPVLGSEPVAMFILPPGAFLVMALLLALFRKTGVIKSG